MTIKQHNPLHPGEFIKHVYIEPFELGSKESAAIVSYLAAHPAAVDLMQGTGGIRKL